MGCFPYKDIHFWRNIQSLNLVPEGISRGTAPLLLVLIRDFNFLNIVLVPRFNRVKPFFLMNPKTSIRRVIPSKRNFDNSFHFVGKEEGTQCVQIPSAIWLNEIRNHNVVFIREIRRNFSSCPLEDPFIITRIDGFPITSLPKKAFV